MLQRFWRLAAVVALTVACDTRTGGVLGSSSPGTKLAFTVQPTDVAANALIIPAVRVEVQDPSGQIVGSQPVDVVLTLVPGTGAAGALLTGGGVVTTVNGIAIFNNLRVDLPGTGYQIAATAAGFPTVASTQFDVVP